MESIIQSFVTFLGVYAAAGIVFALPFSFWGRPGSIRPPKAVHWVFACSCSPPQQLYGRCC